MKNEEFSEEYKKAIVTMTEALEKFREVIKQRNLELEKMLQEAHND